MAAEALNAEVCLLSGPINKQGARLKAWNRRFATLTLDGLSLWASADASDTAAALRAAAADRGRPELTPRWDWSLPEGGRGLEDGSSAAPGVPAQLASNSIFSITQVHDETVHGVVHGMVHYTEHDSTA